jgi:hypothetical protein
VSTHAGESETHWVPREPGRPVPGAMEWLNEHWDDYPGEWVAVRDGQLLGHAATLSELERQIGNIRKSGALVTKIV